MARRRLVTLTTDLGSAYAAQMKAVLYQTLAPGEVVDLSHDLRPHAIPEAAFVFRQMAGGFPAGTVHVAVVDPGVGGRRAPIFVQTKDGSYLVGPDNGVLSPLAEQLGARAAYRIRPERVRISGAPPSRTFEGRDLFAPAAARLALGRSPTELGEPTGYRSLHIAEATLAGRSARGEVLHVDRFGNLITNVPTGGIPAAATEVEVQVSSGRWRKVPRVGTYEEIAPRAPFAVLGSSFGTLELAVREGSAAARLGAVVTSRVGIRWAAPEGRVRAKEGK